MLVKMFTQGTLIFILMVKLLLDFYSLFIVYLP